MSVADSQSLTSYSRRRFSSQLVKRRVMIGRLLAAFFLMMVIPGCNYFLLLGYLIVVRRRLNRCLRKKPISA